MLNISTKCIDCHKIFQSLVPLPKMLQNSKAIDKSETTSMITDQPHSSSPKIHL